MVLVRTDDEVYCAYFVWLGSSRAALPWHAWYVNYRISMLVMIAVMFVQRRVGIGLDSFYSSYVAWTVGVTQVTGQGIDYERPLGQRRMGRAQSQIRHYNHDHDLDPPVWLARQTNRVLEVEDELTRVITELNTRLYIWWRIVVSGVFLRGPIVCKTLWAGARWMVLDPSGPLVELSWLPELAPFSRHINLLCADSNILNPYRVVAKPRPDRAPSGLTPARQGWHPFVEADQSWLYEHFADEEDRGELHPVPRSLGGGSCGLLPNSAFEPVCRPEEMPP